MSTSLGYLFTTWFPSPKPLEGSGWVFSSSSSTESKDHQEINGLIKIVIKIVNYKAIICQFQRYSTRSRGEYLPLIWQGFLDKLFPSRRVFDKYHHRSSFWAKFGLIPSVKIVATATKVIRVPYFLSCDHISSWSQMNNVLEKTKSAPDTSTT